MVDLPAFTKPVRSDAMLRCSVNVYELRHMIKQIFEGCDDVATSVSIGFVELGSLALIADNKEPVFALVGVDESYGSGAPICVALKALIDAVDALDCRRALLRGMQGGGLRVIGRISDVDIEIPPFVKGEK